MKKIWNIYIGIYGRPFLYCFLHRLVVYEKSILIRDHSMDLFKKYIFINLHSVLVPYIKILWDKSVSSNWYHSAMLIVIFAICKIY